MWFSLFFIHDCNNIVVTTDTTAAIIAGGVPATNSLINKFQSQNPDCCSGVRCNKIEVVVLVGASA